MENENKEVLDGKMLVTKKEAKKLLKEHEYKIANNDIDAFVSLQGINKIYPNGVQAVYDFNLDIQKHDFIVLVGPSGCGKSTTLRMVAGLEDISSGYLYIDKILSNYLEPKNRDISMVFQSYALYPQMTVYDNIAFPLKVRKYTKRKVDYKLLNNNAVIDILNSDRLKDLEEAFVEAKNKEKNKGTVYAYVATKMKILEAVPKFFLKKHLLKAEEILNSKEALINELNESNKKEEEILANKNLKHNDKFELFNEKDEPLFEKVKLTKEEIKNKVFHAADILDLGPYLDRRPKELSGGQMQRVALGRAIVRNAKLFLMDEPLSNLDAKLRVQMRSEIVRLHERIGATTIYVTHDQTEAMTMATKIVVMSKGWVQQVGIPQDVYDHPKNLFVATFIGSPAMNIIDAELHKNVLRFKNGYEIKLADDFDEIRTKFYERKIHECERLLKGIDHTLEDEALPILNEVIELNNSENKDVQEMLNKLTKVKEIALNIHKEKTENMLKAIDQAINIVSDTNYNKENVTKALEIVKKFLEFREQIKASDIARLHSAQIYNKANDKKEVLSYAKRKHEFFWNKMINKYKAKHNPVKVMNEYVAGAEDYIKDLLSKFKESLIDTHQVKVGIRPENIHLDSEYNKPNKALPLKVKVDVIERMGSEILLHCDWNDLDLVAKIESSSNVNAHETIYLTFNIERLHIFDVLSGETISKKI